jgi:glucokinase
MYYIGIDLGGTNIAVGIVTEDGTVFAKKSTPTGAGRSENEVIADIAQTVTSLLEETGVSLKEILSVGIGTPGAVDAEEGIVISACNLNFENTDLRTKLGVYFSKPIYVENDANCAAWAEALVGAAKGSENSVMITLGTGIGGGIVVDGHLYHGFNNFAGEFGHTVICVGGEPCKCGKRGCFEAYASATALIRETEKAANGARDSLLWTYAKKEGRFTGRTAFDAAKVGDRTAQAVVDAYIDHLAIGVANAIEIFQPEVLVIGGGISHEGESLFVPLIRRVTEMVYGDRIPEENQTKLLAAFLGNDAGIVGAALLGKEIKR